MIASGIMPKGFPFSIGFRVLFEKGAFELKTVFEGAGPPKNTFQSYSDDGAQTLTIDEHDPYEQELRYFVDSIRGIPDCSMRNTLTKRLTVARNPAIRKRKPSVKTWRPTIDGKTDLKSADYSDYPSNGSLVPDFFLRTIDWLVLHRTTNIAYAGAQETDRKRHKANIRTWHIPTLTIEIDVLLRKKRRAKPCLRLSLCVFAPLREISAVSWGDELRIVRLPWSRPVSS